MGIKSLITVLLISSVTWSQQLEFQYTSQQLNVYNDLTNDVPLFTQNFDDQVSSAIPIVPFTIGGQAYNMLFVSTNGFITLGQAASATNYNPISQPPGTPVIAPFACNLESANNNARISYQIVNGFNNVPTSIIIQWENVRRLGMQGESFSFQAKLNFTSFILPGIEFIYGDFSSVNQMQTLVEIGIRVGSGNTSTSFQNFAINNGGTWVPQQFGSAVNSTCLFPSSSGSSGVPPSGMTHQWYLLYNNNQPIVNTSPICDQNGNVVIYSNYDGGTLNINCDQNIPNLKIGICTYEPVIVNINGPFVGNITEVLYAGFNSNQNNNNCGLGNFTTSISGVNPALVQILTAPPLEYAPTHQNGQAFTSSLMVGVSGQCDTIYYAGGGNTPDEVIAYFLNAFNGDLRFHHTQYNCWLSEVYDLSDGGTCCTNPFVTSPDWQISISNDTSVCFGENVIPTLLTNTGGIAPFSYQWSFNGNILSTVEQFTFSPTQSGTACLTVTDANGDTLSECLNITVSPSPNVTTSPDVTICGGGITTLTAFGANTYTWDNGLGIGASHTVNPVVTTTYNVVGIDLSGCSGSSSVTVTVDGVGPDLQMSAVDAVCFGTATGQASTVATGVGPFIYIWSPTGGTNSTANNLFPGNYTVSVSDPQGCTSIGTITVGSLSQIVANGSVTNSDCNQDNGSILVNPSGGIAPYSYVWLPGGSSNALLANLQAGDYQVNITDVNNCSVTNNFTVGLNDNFLVSVDPFISTIQYQESAQLEATSVPALPGAIYAWSPNEGLSCSDCPNPIASPIVNTTYTVTVTATNGCIQTAQATVNAQLPCGEAFMPTIFSPNGDALNDKLCLMGSCVQTMTYSIYNRWGELVFTSKSQTECWDGTFRGNPIPVGVYAYKLQVTLTDGTIQEESGNITLAR